MRWILFLILIASSSFAFADEIVAVRLKKSMGVITITGKSITCCSRKISHDAILSDTFKVCYRRIDGLSYWEVYNKDADITKMYNTKSLFFTGPDMYVGAIKAPRYIEFYAKKTSFDVIAHIGLENYLKGVLPSEMPASWPMASLKAQAIASRSYTLAMIKQRSKGHFNLESTVSDQVFDLSKHAAVSDIIKKKIYKAISETKGKVLLNKKSNIHKAYYHADCGGHTEEPGLVWNFTAKNGTAKDPYCPSHRNSKWQTTFSHKKISKLLQDKLGVSNDDVFKNLLVLNKSPSGRAVNVKLQFSNKERVITAQKMREILGYSKMKSTLFSFNNSKSGVTIKGKGNGHGVGLCQWGAKHWAGAGKSYTQILKHYYPTAKIHKF